MAGFNKPGNTCVQQLILALFFLLLSIQQHVESFAVKCLSDRVPPKPCYGYLVELPTACLLVSVLDGNISTVERNFLHGVGLLRDCEPAQTTPELNIQLQFNLFLFVWMPIVHRVEGFLNKLLLAVGDQFKVAKHFTSEDISLSRSCLFLYDFYLTFAAFARCFFLHLVCYFADLLGYTCFDRVKSFAKVTRKLFVQ